MEVLGLSTTLLTEVPSTLDETGSDYFAEESLAVMLSGDIFVSAP